MLNDYLMVHKSILPENYQKVIEAGRLIETGKARDVSAAVKMVGISRSTYYKYKDYVFEPSGVAGERKAVFSMLLTHEPGVLSALLAKISNAGCSVLTISQSPPVHGFAAVTISVDAGTMQGSLDSLLADIAELQGVDSPKLISVE